MEQKTWWISAIQFLHFWVSQGTQLYYWTTALLFNCTAATLQYWMYYCNTAILNWCTFSLLYTIHVHVQYSVHGRGGLGRRKPDWAPLPLGTTSPPHRLHKTKLLNFSIFNFMVRLFWWCQSDCMIDKGVRKMRMIKVDFVQQWLNRGWSKFKRKIEVHRICWLQRIAVRAELDYFSELNSAWKLTRVELKDIWEQFLKKENSSIVDFPMAQWFLKKV